MTPRIRNRRAFTLIEVMTATVILVIVLPVLATAFNLAGNIAGLTRQRTEAVALAESTLDKMICENDIVQQHGELTTTGAYSYAWDSTVETWDEPNTQLVTVKVTFTHRGMEHEVTLSTVVYIPDSTIQTTTGGAGIGGRP